MRILGLDKQLVQKNRGNILGSVWSTFNIDTQSNIGAIRVSPRMILNTNGLNDCPWGIKFFDTKFWVGAGTFIYGGGADAYTTFSADASTGFQSDFSSDESDMETFNGTLCATTTDALYSKASNGSGGGAWTSRDSLTTGGQHVMCYFRRHDRLYYSDVSSIIRSIDTAWSTADPGSNYAINLSSDSGAYTITSMKATPTEIFIGTIDKTKEGQVGKIMRWDGYASQAFEHKLNAQGCLAIIIDQREGVPYAIDTNGVLLRYNRAGFQEVGRLPLSDKHLKVMNDQDATDRFIHPNGLLFTKDGSILCLTNNINVDGSWEENFQGGVYEFIPQGDGTFSCHHRYSPSYYTVAGASITDYGQSRFSKVGVLASVDVYSTNANRNGKIMMGATYYTNASSTSSGVFYDDSNDTLQKAGYLVTTKIFSAEVKDMWQDFIVKLGRRFLDSGNKIIPKYRITEASPTEITITTWSSSNTIRTSTSVTGYTTGDEVEILQGEGAGRTFHIASAPTDLGGGITEITLDDSFTGLSGSGALARLQKWKKLGEMTSQSEDYREWQIGVSSTWIQFKIFFLFKGKDEVVDFTLNNIKHQ